MCKPKLTGKRFSSCIVMYHFRGCLPEYPHIAESQETIDEYSKP